MSRPLPHAKIKQAAKLHRTGATYAAIAQAFNVHLDTVRLWSRSEIWRDELRILEQTEREAAVDAVAANRAKYTQELMRSRDLLRQCCDSHVQLAGMLTIAATKATRAIAQDDDPVAAVGSLSKQGVCHVASTAAQLTRVASDLIDKIYAINQVLEYIEDQK